MHNDLTMLGYQNLPLEALPSARVVRDWSHALLPLSDLQAGSWMARQTHATYGFDASSKLGDHVAVLIASAREEGKKRRSMMLGGCFLTHSTAEAGLADMLEHGVYAVERVMASAHEHLTAKGIDADFIPKLFNRVRVLVLQLVSCAWTHLFRSLRHADPGFVAHQEQGSGVDHE
jgi:hypothetical protein